MYKVIYFFIAFYFLSTSALATKWYVDDASNVGDVYTPASIAGSNANAGTPAAPFATVNFALTQAAPFDTIYVDAGTYNEQVILTKSIYVFGASSALSIFNGGNKTAGGGVGFTIDKNVVSDVRALSIIQYNLGVSHNGGLNTDTLYTRFANCNISDNFSNGLRYFGSIRLKRFVMDTCTMTTNNGTTISRAILVLGPENDSVFIRQSLFTANPFVGIDFNTPPSTRTNKFVSITQCTVTGCAQPGIAVHGFLSGQLQNNVLTNCGFAAMEIKTCLGNGNTSGIGSFVISKNTISRTIPSLDRRDICGIAVMNRDANIAGASGTLSTKGIVLSENEISNYSILNTPVVGAAFTPTDVTAWAAAPYNSQVPDTLFDAFGMVLEGANHLLLNNKFINCEIGVMFQQLPAFTGTTAPISDFFDANRVYTATTTSVNAQFNGFYGCTKNIRSINKSANAIDCSNSFFNAFSALSIAATLQEYTSAAPLPFPAINPHLIGFNPFTPTGAIDFSPWVKNNGDPAAVGYQGDYTTLIVDNESPNNGLRPYLQEGHDNTFGSPVLNVQIEPGFYAERNVVSKSIHYIGVNSPTLNVLQMNGIGDTLYVDAGFELKDSLYCLNGLINTFSLSTLLLKETCVSDLGINTSFVNGPLHAERLSAGNFTLHLPIGKENIGNRSTQLSLIQTNAALTTYTAEYFPANAPILPINLPIAPTWTPQSYWRIDDGGTNNFSSPQLTLQYGTNDYSPASAHSIAKRVNPPAWDYIKDLTPVFVASSGTVSSSPSQNSKFTQWGEFAIAPINECPKAIASFTNSLCLGDTLQAVNSSTIGITNFITAYTWNFGDGSPSVIQTGTFTPPSPANPAGPKHVYTVAGTYTVKLIALANAGCKDSTTFSVTVNPLPTGTVSPTGTVNLCPSVTLTANGLSVSNYTWAAVPALSITATSTLGISLPGKYFIRLENANGCKAVSDTLTVIAIPCRDALGVSKKVERLAHLGGGVFDVTYVIKAKNYGTTPITAIQLNEPLALVFPPPATYTLVNLTTLSGNFLPNAAFNGSTTVNLLSTPANSLALNDSSSLELRVFVKPGTQITFRNLVTAVGTGSFGNVSDSSMVGDLGDPNGDGIPNEFGTTDINLIADFLMPTGFSPDGDNVNDLLVIQGIETYPDNELQVYNRWGNLVFKKSTYQNTEAWDARPNTGGLLLPGNKVPAGTYFYVLKLNSSDKPLTGSLTIKY